MVPIEVKSGNVVHSKSPGVFEERYSPEFAVILSARNSRKSGARLYAPLYGIMIAIYYEANAKHNKPHIHARYQGKKASIAIEDGETLAGDLPLKQLKMVQV